MSPCVPRVHLFILLAFSVLFTVSLHSQTKVWNQRTAAVGYNVGINPLNPNTIYAERVSGILEVSRNKGLTWTDFPSSPPLSGIRHILVHPKDTLTIFAVDFSNGLYRTTNEGTSWTLVIAGYGIDGESIDLDPVHPDTMFAGNYGDGAVYRSLNRGATWTLRGISGPHLCALSVRPDSTNIIYAGTGASTISKSYDYGATWKTVNSGGTDEVPKFAINPAHPLIAYATTYGPDYNDYLWKTTNGGEAWFKTSLQHLGIWSVAMDVQHPETLYIGHFGATNGIERTTDGGVTFQNFSRGIFPNFAAWNLRVHPLAPNDVWVAGVQNVFGPPGGVFKLVDTTDFTRVQGTVRDAVTNSPVAATTKILATNDLSINSSTFDFYYYAGDPTLTPIARIQATGYFPKDTMLTFVLNTTRTEDVHLLALPPNSISGNVFNDQNGNALKDGGEPGLANWRVRLTGAMTASTLTDANGNYAFGSLVTGSYTVSESLETGWTQLMPACPGTYPVNFIAGTNVTDIDFGNEAILPGSTLMIEGFDESFFPPSCWSVVNGGTVMTWHQIGSIVHSAPFAARNGFGNIPDGKADDWLVSGSVQLNAGSTYRLSWWDRTFINGSATGICSLAVGVGTTPLPAGLTQVINSRGFNTLGNYENITQTFTVAATGTYYIGFHDFSAAGNTLRIDDVLLTFVSAPGFFITGQKFHDKNGNGIKDPGDNGLQNWTIFLDANNNGALDLGESSTTTDGSGSYAFLGLSPGTYKVREVQQAGWIQTTANPADISSSTAGIDFGNFHPGAISGMKFNDANNNGAQDLSEVGLQNWKIRLTGTVTDSALTDANGNYRFGNLPAGSYNVSEDLVAGWVQTKPVSGSYNVTLTGADSATGKDFGNFHPNSLTVRKYQDNDGDPGTSGDQVPKRWHLKILKAPSGPVVAEGDSEVVVANNLVDGDYTAIEADSTGDGWIFLGWIQRMTPAGPDDPHLCPGGCSPVGQDFTLSGGQNASIDFINAPPAYSKTYRSFSPATIAHDVDNAGKAGKFVKRKADKVEVKLVIIAPKAATGFTIKFSMPFTGSVRPDTLKNSVLAPISATNTVTVTTAVDSGHAYQIDGFGSKGKLITASVTWLSSPKTIKQDYKLAFQYLVNQPRLPMPNTINALFETFAQFAFLSTNGLLVGKDKTLPDSTKKYGWYQAGKYTEVYKTLNDKGSFHTADPHGFDVFLNSHPVLKRQKTLSPMKYNNRLLADLIALKLNIAASVFAKTPVGFGELIYNDGTSNLLNGMMVKDIARYGDSLMMGYYDITQAHKFADSSVFNPLERVVSRIDSAFEGSLDTLNPGFAAKLRFKGVRRLFDVPYLRPNSTVIPSLIEPVSSVIVETPTMYRLYQNYPNPFNPTTTIQFDLPDPSVVTLKVYNMLGQEVASLLDHEQMDDGVQEVDFNAGVLASGVYFYRIVAEGLDEDGAKTNSFQTVRKMLLLK